MSTENMIRALDVSEKGQTSTAWKPMVLKPEDPAAPLSWVVSEKHTQPKRTVPEPLPKPTVEVPLRPDASFEDMIDHNPAGISRVVEGFLEQDTTEAGIHQVAILMIGLGAQRAARILQLLPESEMIRISKSVVDCKTITEQQKKDVLGMFRQRLLSGDTIFHGGAEFARDMLHKAFGPKQGNDFLSRVLPEERTGFRLVQEATVEQLLPFVNKEHPQAIALIMSQLNTDQAAGVLNRLSPDLQVDVICRLAKMDNISPQVMRDLENSLAEDLRAVMTGQITEIGGPKSVAEILNRANRNTEKAILERIDTQDEELAEKVRLQMFVFDDVFKLPQKDLQTVIASIDDSEWAVALKGAWDHCLEIFKNAAEALKNENIEEKQKALGAVRMSQVEEAQVRVVQKVRQLEAAGKITIERVDVDEVIL